MEQPAKLETLEASCLNGRLWTLPLPGIYLPHPKKSVLSVKLIAKPLARFQEMPIAPSSSRYEIMNKVQWPSFSSEQSPRRGNSFPHSGIVAGVTREDCFTPRGISPPRHTNREVTSLTHPLVDPPAPANPPEEPSLEPASVNLDSLKNCPEEYDHCPSSFRRSLQKHRNELAKPSSRPSTTECSSPSCSRASARFPRRRRFHEADNKNDEPALLSTRRPFTNTGIPTLEGWDPADLASLRLPALHRLAIRRANEVHEFTYMTPRSLRECHYHAPDD
mmetsp:Transcript_21825/g.36117  ORF Transcript_21825/g.36117 Transcript_21825/m.36117 type:complete len:277 (+) Transcript_21825:86-916(+)